MKIIETQKEFMKNGLRWEEKDSLIHEIDEKEYNLIVENRMKGDRYTRGYTPAGYKVVKIVSVEPMFKTSKFVREFTFEK